MEVAHPGNEAQRLADFFHPTTQPGEIPELYLRRIPGAALPLDRGRAPELYQRVKAAVQAGRWEVQGATWVEMDSNLISGESMLRQFYYGKQFFRREFGLDMKILWLPDSFGYSACLPQVMKLAGVPIS